MNPEQELRVAGLGLWLPGFPTLAAYQRGERDPDAERPAGTALDRINRRRASLLGRALADVAAGAMTAAGVDPAAVPTVVGSSIGEASTMIGLLDQMVREEEPMSPAAFTMSVHNAASGLISISNKNRGYTTSIAADEDTPAAALMEGLGLLVTRGQPVVVVCGDEAAPADLVPESRRWSLLAAALVLVPASHPSGRRMRLLGPGEATLPRAQVEQGIARNPVVGMVDLVDALLRGTPGLARLDRGDGAGYRAQIEAEA